MATICEVAAKWTDPRKVEWSMLHLTPGHMSIKNTELQQTIARDAINTIMANSSHHASKGTQQGVEWRQVSLRIAQLRKQGKT